MPSPGTSHKDRDPVGRQIEPCGYIKVPAPPSDWSVVIDGHKITPRVIQRTLRRCRDAGVDMWYVAERLGIGSGAIVMYMQRERSIPESVAKRFYTVFSSGEPLPKVTTAPMSKTIDWSVEEKEPHVSSVIIPERTPDFDGEALGLALLQKRRDAQMTIEAAARRAKCSVSFVSSVEAGQTVYKSERNSVLFRLCLVFGIDVRQYELKPRVDFPKFKQAVIDAKISCADSWPQLRNRAGVSEKFVQKYLQRGGEYVNVVYLDGYIERLCNAYDIDVNKIIIPRDTPIEKLNAPVYTYSMLRFKCATFRHDIRARRQELRYTQGRVAQKAGTNQSCIHKLESGVSHRPTYNTVKKVCNALGLDMQKYFDK